MTDKPATPVTTTKPSSRTFRQWLVLIAAAAAAGLAWASLAVTLARVIRPIPSSSAWLFIGFPVAVLVIVLIWRRLPRIFGFPNK